MHNLLLRAILTGFGLRVGSELGKLVARKIFPEEKSDKAGETEEDDELGSVTPDPPVV